MATRRLSLTGYSNAPSILQEQIKRLNEIIRDINPWTLSFRNKELEHQYAIHHEFEAFRRIARSCAVKYFLPQVIFNICDVVINTFVPYSTMDDYVQLRMSRLLLVS